MKVFSHYLRWRFGLEPPETQTTERERACLSKHAANKRRLVEIGVWEGVTTKLLRTAMARDGILLAVDPFPVGRLGISFHQRIARTEVGKITRGKVKWIRESGTEALREAHFQGIDHIDFIFIDGDHLFDAVRLDWTLWSPFVAPHGIVALHDSRPTLAREIELAGSVVFTQRYVLSDPRFHFVDAVDSLTVVQRCA